MYHDVNEPNISKDMINYSKPFIANSISWWINNASDKYVLLLFCNIETTGIYSISYKIPSILEMIQNVFAQAWQISAIKEYKDKNLSYCAVCDGFFYRGRTAYVLGDGTYAVSEALELEKNAKEVVILTNGKNLTVTSNKIKVETRKIKAFKGEDRLSQIVFEDEDTINVPSLFIAWKNAGGYDFARKLGASIQNDKIEVNPKMETSIPGLYACGDVVGSPFQVAKAVYEGEIAGTNCSDYLKNNRKA